MFDSKEKKILGLLFFVHFLMIVDFMIIMPMGPHIMNRFGTSASQLSLLVSSFTLAAGGIGLLAARFLDRFHHKSILQMATLGFIGGNLSCALAQDFWQLCIARGVTGIFVGIIGTLMLVILSNNIPVEKRGRAIGFLMSAVAIASIIGVPFCLFLYQRFNWSAPFWFIAFGSVLFLILTQATSFESPLLQKTKTPLLQSRQQKFSVLFIIFLILGHFSINPFLFVSLIQNAKILESELTPIYLCAGLGAILASIVAGVLVDKIGHQKIFTVSLLLSLFAIFWVTHQIPNHFLLANLSITSFFIIMSARMTAAMTWIVSKSNLETRGSFMSLINSFQHLSAALAAFIAGQIVEKTPTGEILNFEYVGFTAIGFSLIALGIPLLIEKSPVALKS